MPALQRERFMDAFGFTERLRHVQHRVQALVDLGSAGSSDQVVQAFVDLLPTAFACERCSIFLADPEGDALGSKYGTGIEEGEIQVTDPESVAGRVALTGESVIDNQPDLSAPSHRQAAKATGFQVVNLLCVPVRSRAMGSEIVGVVEVLNKKGGFDVKDQQRLESLSAALSHAIEVVWAHDRLLSLGAELSRELAALPDQNRGFIASDPLMLKVLDLVEAVGPTPADVLITGENGTGKELVARRIHQLSGDPGRPFIAVNCAAIPENLIESEFFGHERGAFTGADRSRPGFLEMAQGGTLFLDEIAELPLSLQAKLLRVLQEKEGRRVGGQKLVRYRFRLLSATNQDLEARLEAKTFRDDLYYRLFAVRLEVPPLRDRKKDIPLLLERFVVAVSGDWNKPVASIDPEVITQFEAYDWPGNVRQLLREVERLVALTPAGGQIRVEHCSPELGGKSLDRLPSVVVDGSMSLKQQVKVFEQRVIEATLEFCDQKKSKTAGHLGISRQALHSKLKEMDD